MYHDTVDCDGFERYFPQIWVRSCQSVPIFSYCRYGSIDGYLKVNEENIIEVNGINENINENLKTDGENIVSLIRHIIDRHKMLTDGIISI